MKNSLLLLIFGLLSTYNLQAQNLLSITIAAPHQIDQVCLFDIELIPRCQDLDPGKINATMLNVTAGTYTIRVMTLGSDPLALWSTASGVSVSYGDAQEYYHLGGRTNIIVSMGAVPKIYSVTKQKISSSTTRIIIQGESLGQLTTDSNLNLEGRDLRIITWSSTSITASVSTKYLNASACRLRLSTGVGGAEWNICQ